MSKILVILFLFLFLLLSFIYFAVEVFRGKNIYKKYRHQLEKEGIIGDSFFEYIQYMKEKNPWGGFVHSERISENLLKDSSSKEIESIVNQIASSHKEVIKRGKIILIIFFIYIVVLLYFKNI